MGVGKRYLKMCQVSHATDGFFCLSEDVWIWWGHQLVQLTRRKTLYGLHDLAPTRAEKQKCLCLYNELSGSFQHFCRCLRVDESLKWDESPRKGDYRKQRGCTALGSAFKGSGWKMSSVTAQGLSACCPTPYRAALCIRYLGDPSLPSSAI